MKIVRAEKENIGTTSSIKQKLKISKQTLTHLLRLHSVALFLLYSEHTLIIVVYICD